MGMSMGGPHGWDDADPDGTGIPGDIRYDFEGERWRQEHYARVREQLRAQQVVGALIGLAR